MMFELSFIYFLDMLLCEDKYQKHEVFVGQHGFIEQRDKTL